MIRVRAVAGGSAILMPDGPESGFSVVLETLVPRLRDYAIVLLGPGPHSEGLLQSAVAVAASRHLLAAAARADAVRAMPEAVAAVLGAWLDRAPGVPAQLGEAVHELFDELTDAAARARVEGAAGAALVLALAAATSELERAHGWLWLPPTLPAPASARPELARG